MLWQSFSLPGIENGIEYRYFSRYRIEVRNSSIVTTLVCNTLINMGLDKFGCFMQMYVYYYWNHSQHRAWRLCLKAIDVLQRTCSCLLDTLKRNTRFPLLLFLCTEQFTDTKTFTSLQDRAAQNVQNVNSLYYLLMHLFASLCPHTVFWCS